MEQIVYEFEKGQGEKVRASISDFAGKRRADIRVYFETDDGQWHPTKRGVSINADLLVELKMAVDKLVEEINA